MLNAITRKGSVLGCVSMMPREGGRLRWGEWEDLERVEGAQLHTEVWAQQHMMEWWLHTGLVREHSVEKQKVQTDAMLLC